MLLLVALIVPGAVARASDSCAVMQVVAHEDDDLLFMNPDIEEQIRSGQCSVTVFATAGNGEPTTRNRQIGIKDAYRQMGRVADQPDQTEWDSASLTVAGYPVEQFYLRDRPSVRIVFMNLDDPLSSTGRPGLSRLWNNTATSMSVINPDTGNPTTVAPTTITRGGVSNVLTGLMALFTPTTLRIQDTVPDSRYMTDHPDHIATAQFAQDAAHTYRVNTGIAANIVYYRDYNITSSPENLDAANRADKDQRFSVEYTRLNPTATADAAGYYWTNRTYYRWARGTSWVGRDADGRLEAFVVKDGEVFNWSEAADGTWGVPISLGRPGAGLYPAVTVSKNADGRLQIFARGIDNTIMTAFQTAPNGGWSPWTSLGNPHTGMSAGQVGTPAVAINADGRMQVFVKDGAGGISTRTQSAANDATWSAWASLGGTGLHDPVVAATNRGLIEVFASTTTAVKRWRQTTANGTIVADPFFTSGRPAGPPAIGVNQDGRLEVQYRTAGSISAAPTTDLEIVVQNTPGGSWRSTRVHAGTNGGIGEPSPLTTGLTAADQRILSFTRNRAGGVSLVRQTAANAGYGTAENLGGGLVDNPAAANAGHGASENLGGGLVDNPAAANAGYGASENLGGTFVDYPAAAIDRGNRVNVFAVGLDGNLWINRQTVAGPTASFAGWFHV